MIFFASFVFFVSFVSCVSNFATFSRKKGSIPLRKRHVEFFAHISKMALLALILFCDKNVNAGFCTMFQMEPESIKFALLMIPLPNSKIVKFLR